MDRSADRCLRGGTAKVVEHTAFFCSFLEEREVLYAKTWKFLPVDVLFSKNLAGTFCSCIHQSIVVDQRIIAGVEEHVGGAAVGSGNGGGLVADVLLCLGAGGRIQRP